MRNDISTPEWVSCLERLREARALVLRDAESFHEAAMALEYVGQLILGEIKNGLGGYGDDLIELARIGKACEHDKVVRLFHVVKDARNMAVHDGAWVRERSSKLIELILYLEGGIVKKLLYAEDLMVHTPVIAERWQMVSHVRRLMLENSFSYLPIEHEKALHLISDLKLVQYVRADPKLERDRLATTIGAALDGGEITLIEAHFCKPDIKISEVIKKISDRPLLITELGNESSRLLGLIMPFDLL